MMSEITKVETQPLAEHRPSEVENMIRIALDKGLNPTELYAILREERATRAKQAFTEALRKFQSECPPIPKNHQAGNAGGDTRSGKAFGYAYATKPEIRAVIKPHLEANGFTIQFGSLPAPSPKQYTATCTVKHIGGHEETVPITGPIDTGRMTDVQQIGSTQTYYERYALGAALALDIGGLDTDGDSRIGTGAKITDEQVNALNDLIIAVGDSRGRPIDQAAFLSIFKAKTLADIPASRFDEAVGKLESQRPKVTT